MKTKVDASRTALLIVDVQCDFLPGGALVVPKGDEVVNGCATFAAHFRTVVATQDFHPPGHVSFASSHPGARPFERTTVHGRVRDLWPEHCVAGTSGAELHPAVLIPGLSMVLRKGTRQDVDSYSGFLEDEGSDGRRAPTGLAGFLRDRGINVVISVGLARDYCVRATALDAVTLGFTSIVVDDLTRAARSERRQETDADLQAGGVIVVHSTDLQLPR